MTPIAPGEDTGVDARSDWEQRIYRRLTDTETPIRIPLCRRRSRSWPRRGAASST